MKKRFLIVSIPLVVFLAIVILFWKGLSLNPGELPSALIGKPMPDFKLTSVTDPKVILTPEIFLGHVSVINVWASWCMACRAEHGMLMDISKQSGFKLYGLNYKDTLDAANQWLTTFGNPFVTSIYDPQGTLGIDLGVYGVPETFILDKAGMIRYKYIGEIKTSDWKNKLWPVIQKLQ